MADAIGCYIGNTLVHTGKGWVSALVISATSGNPVITIYNNTSATGTKIFECIANVYGPLVIIFPDGYAPRFSIGCYLAIGTGGSVTIWTRNQ